MGQAITVTVRSGVRGDVKHFELNRSLTGMQTHRYTNAESVTGTKPPDELARRIFTLPGVSAVTIYSSVVTVVAPAEQWATLQPKVEDTIANLFIHYKDGQPPAVPAETGSAEAGAAEGSGPAAPAEPPAPAQEAPVSG